MRHSRCFVRCIPAYLILMYRTTGLQQLTTLAIQSLTPEYALIVTG